MMRITRTILGMATTTIQATDAARQIGRLFDRASRGETILVTRYGRPYAVISPPPPEGADGPQSD